MDSEVRQAILWLNPWLETPDCFAAEVERHLPAPFLPRAASSDLADAVDDPRAHLVIGPRQAGKSSLVWSLVRSRGPSVLYLTCDDALVRRWCRSPVQFAAEASELLPPGGVLFLDEAQRLDEAGLFVKGVVDRRPGWSLVVTGSSSFHLLAATRESLAGRATRHRVWPLDLDEVSVDAASLAPIVRRTVRARHLSRMLLEGGYPAVWTAADPRRELHELVEAFVLRDASDRFSIERPEAFRRVLRLAAGQVGDIVRRSEWAAIVGVSAPTVSSYVGLLEETHVLATVRPFVGGRRAELTSAPKVYFVDNGLRNAVSGGFEPLDRRADVGRLLESWVYSELHKRYPDPGDVRYWRTKNGAEVDFVLEPTPGELIGVEVKARQGPRPKLTRSTRSFIDAYAPTEVLLVYRGEPHEERIGSTRVRWVPAELLSDALPATSTSPASPGSSSSG